MEIRDHQRDRKKPTTAKNPIMESNKRFVCLVSSKSLLRCASNLTPETARNWLEKRDGLLDSRRLGLLDGLELVRKRNGLLSGGSLGFLAAAFNSQQRRLQLLLKHQVSAYRVLRARILRGLRRRRGCRSIRISGSQVPEREHQEKTEKLKAF